MPIHWFSSKAFLTLALTSFLVLVQAPAFAELVSTNQLATKVQTDSKRAELTALLARSEVRAQMAELGVDANDATTRVDRMSDSEVTSVYSRLNALPAGGGALGIVLTLVLIFILLDVAGVTDVFPRI